MFKQVEELMDEAFDTLESHAVPTRVCRIVESYVYGKKLTDDETADMIDALRDSIQGHDQIWRCLEQLGGIAEEAIASRFQHAMEETTEAHDNAPQPKKGPKKMEKLKMKSPTTEEILKMAASGITITSKKTAATDDMPWVHGRTINKLVEDGLLKVGEQADHERVIWTTPQGLQSIAEDADGNPIYGTIGDDEDVEEVEEVEEVEDVEMLEGGGVSERCVVFVTLSDDGQVSVDLDAQAILEFIAKGLKS